MVELIDVAAFAEAVLTILLGVFLFWKSSRKISINLAGIVIAGFGAIVLVLLAIAANLTARWPAGGQELLVPLLGIVLSAELLFAALYPSFRPVGWRGWLAGFAAFPLVASAVYVATVLTGNVRIAAFWHDVNTFGAHFLVSFSLIALAYSFIRARTPLLRNQLLFALLAFLVWGLNHAVPATLRQAITGAPSAPQIVIPGLLQAVLLLGVFAFLAWDAKRTSENRSQNLIVLTWYIIVTPLAFLQFIDGRFHALVDGLTVVALFYGIARYQIPKVDLNLPNVSGRTVLGAFALPLFFITQQALESFAGRLLGVTGAVVATGLGLFFLKLGENRVVAAAAPPGKARSSGYANFRRFEIYRTALEGVYADGAIDVSESRTLAGLRHKLGITDADHRRLERDVRAVRRIRGAPSINAKDAARPDPDA